MSDDDHTRRDFVRSAGAALAAVGFAGCSSGSRGGGEETSTKTVTPTETPNPGEVPWSPNYAFEEVLKTEDWLYEGFTGDTPEPTPDLYEEIHQEGVSKVSAGPPGWKALENILEVAQEEGVLPTQQEWHELLKTSPLVEGEPDYTKINDNTAIVTDMGVRKGGEWAGSAYVPIHGENVYFGYPFPEENDGIEDQFLPYPETSISEDGGLGRTPIDIGSFNYFMESFGGCTDRNTAVGVVRQRMGNLGSSLALNGPDHERNRKVWPEDTESAKYLENALENNPRDLAEILINYTLEADTIENPENGYRWHRLGIDQDNNVNLDEADGALSIPEMQDTEKREPAEQAMREHFHEITCY